MSTAMGFSVQPNRVCYAMIVDGDLDAFGTIARRNGAGFVREYDDNVRRVVDIAKDASAPIFIEAPALPTRDISTWRDYAERCEAVGEITTHARLAGVRGYRADVSRVCESLYGARLGSKRFQVWLQVRAKQKAVSDLTDTEALALVIAEYGAKYLDGDVAGTLSPSAA